MSSADIDEMQSLVDGGSVTAAKPVGSPPQQELQAAPMPGALPDEAEVEQVSAPTVAQPAAAAPVPSMPHLHVVKKGASKAQLEEVKLRELFSQLDEDGSDSLDKKEVKKLAKLLGDAMKPAALRDAFERMDRLNKGEVNFNQFKKWWFQKKEEERKQARKKAKELFEIIDADHSGLLDKDEFKQLSKTLIKKFPKVELVDGRGKPSV